MKSLEAIEARVTYTLYRCATAHKKFKKLTWSNSNTIYTIESKYIDNVRF